MPPRLGAHMSIAGGVDRAVQRAVEAGCEALQVFTRSASQWAARPLGNDECRRFRVASAAARLQPVLAHDSYLINLASPDAALWRRSVDALVGEVERCAALGVPYLVLHPGAHMGSGVETGVARVATALDEVVARTAPGVTLLLENTAGQGTCLGASFDELAAISGQLRRPERVAVCVDTAHAFAAGYDLASDRGWEATWRAVDRAIGLARVCALHVNDSRRERGSRVDRHEHIGLGRLGASAFWRLVNDPRFEGLPGVLETEKTGTGHEDELNLRVLRRMVGRSRPPTRPEVLRWRRPGKR